MLLRILRKMKPDNLTFSLNKAIFFVILYSFWRIWIFRIQILERFRWDIAQKRLGNIDLDALWDVITNAFDSNIEHVPLEKQNKYINKQHSNCYALMSLQIVLVYQAHGLN